MYNATQIIYIIASLALSIGILIGSYFIKKQKHKDMFFKILGTCYFYYSHQYNVGRLPKTRQCECA